MDKCKRKPYTQAELDQQAIWADEFDQWWESEGQYHRAGGGNYERTFAWWAWLSREQSRQSEFEAITEALLNQTQLLAKQKVEVGEKDKRIEACLKTVNDKFELAKSLAQGKTTPGLSIMYETAKEMKCAVDEALRGEHE